MHCEVEGILEPDVPIEICIKIYVLELAGSIDIEKTILSVKTIIGEIVEIDDGKETGEEKGNKGNQEDNF